MTRSKRERVERKLDRAIERYIDDVGPREMELLLQERAQALHEVQEPAVSESDLEGWSQ